MNFGFGPQRIEIEAGIERAYDLMNRTQDLASLTKKNLIINTAQPASSRKRVQSTDRGTLQMQK